MLDEKYQDGLRLLGGFHALRGRENDIMRKLETIGHKTRMNTNK
jgi:hypothetical protein